MRKRSKALAVVALISISALIGISLARQGVGSISATFSRYGEYSSVYLPTYSGIFLIRNTGPRTVICRGVGASYEHQLTQVLGPKGWTNTDQGWLSPGAMMFHLAPGEAREVPVLIGANSTWRVGFRFRERGFLDCCPWFIWQLIPSRLRKVPSYRELWTEPVEPYERIQRI
jgi:hypothetical protein